MNRWQVNVMLGLTALIVILALQLRSQRKQIGTLRDELAITQARYSAANTDMLAAEQARLNTESALLREKQEKVRLAAEVARLRRESDPTERALAKRSKPGADLSKTDDSEWLRKYTVNVQTTVPHGDALLTGGWLTQDGRRAFLMLHPSQVDAAGNQSRAADATQVTVKNYWLEVNPESVDALGLQELLTNSQSSGSHKVLSAADAAALLEKIKNTPGVDVLAAPLVTTGNGREAVISVEDSFTAPNGHVLSTGPSAHLVPTITSNGVDISLQAELALKRTD